MIINTDLIYPIGSIYLSVNATNPSKYFGGTWEQITGDAYLKIVSSGAGSLGGTSADHKIPVESMPSHSHDLIIHSGGTLNDTVGVGGTSNGTKSGTLTGGTGWGIRNKGGSQAYYPYYYGVYVFKRTA